MIRLKDFRDDDLWSLFEASASGDLPAVKRLVEARPELVDAKYNYTPAIHFAVREGHLRAAVSDCGNLRRSRTAFLVSTRPDPRRL